MKIRLSLTIEARREHKPEPAPEEPPFVNSVDGTLVDLVPPRTFGFGPSTPEVRA